MVSLFAARIEFRDGQQGQSCPSFLIRVHKTDNSTRTLQSYTIFHEPEFWSDVQALGWKCKGMSMCVALSLSAN